MGIVRFTLEKQNKILYNNSRRNRNENPVRIFVSKNELKIRF